ncbi:hypothetical protein HN51_022360 [Arachis hypogaea]
MGLVVDVGSGQSSQSLANRPSRAEAAPHSHSQSQEPTPPNPMGVPLKNRVQAAPKSEEEAWTIPSQQWHTGEPNPFDSRYGGSKLDLVVPAACMIRIEMGCRCCLLRKLWGPSSPIQEAHPDLGKTNTAVMYGMRDLDAKPILFCHRPFSSCVSIGEVQVWFFLFCYVKQTTGFVFCLVEGKDTVCCVGWNPCLSSMLIRFRYELFECQTSFIEGFVRLMEVAAKFVNLPMTGRPGTIDTRDPP